MKKYTDMKDRKPAPFIASGAEKTVSKEEIERRLIRLKRAQEIGQDLTRVDSGESETENPYRVEALIYIMNDKEVPDALKKKIEQFDEAIKQNNLQALNKL